MQKSIPLYKSPAEEIKLSKKSTQLSETQKRFNIEKKVSKKESSQAHILQESRAHHIENESSWHINRRKVMTKFWVLHNSCPGLAFIFHSLSSHA